MDDYPTDDELERITKWPHDDPAGWFKYVRSVGNYWSDQPPWGWHEETADDDGKQVKEIHVSTGGWSGNEDIILAMQQNFVLWSLNWYQHQTGGHYIFRLHPALGE